MQREFKFRIWASIEAKWIKDLCLLTQAGWLFKFDPFGNIIPEIPKRRVSDGNEYIIQQFTGLKDKNHKEIYEGDILKVARCHIVSEEKVKGVFSCHGIEDGIEIGNVFWSDCFCQWTISFEHIRHDDFDAMMGGISHRYEIIGNIFETPQLLNK